MAYVALDEVVLIAFVIDVGGGAHRAEYADAGAFVAEFEDYLGLFVPRDAGDEVGLVLRRAVGILAEAVDCEREADYELTILRLVGGGFLG